MMLRKKKLASALGLGLFGLFLVADVSASQPGDDRPSNDSECPEPYDDCSGWSGPGNGPGNGVFPPGVIPPEWGQPPGDGGGSPPSDPPGGGSTPPDEDEDDDNTAECLKLENNLLREGCGLNTLPNNRYERGTTLPSGFNSLGERAVSTYFHSSSNFRPHVFSSHTACYASRSNRRAAPNAVAKASCDRAFALSGMAECARAGSTYSQSVCLVALYATSGNMGSLQADINDMIGGSSVVDGLLRGLPSDIRNMQRWHVDKWQNSGRMLRCENYHQLREINECD